MHRLLMNNVGPIKHCDINIDKFTVLTGAQAAGKSTIAKSIFFFRTIKDDILDILLKKSIINPSMSLKKLVARHLRNKFLQIFGSSRAMDNNLLMRYEYGKNTYVEITLRFDEGANYISPNYIYFEFSDNIGDFLSNYSSKAENELKKSELTLALKQLFSDEYETIFIPAGRSLITLLTTQLNYIFTVMDEEQKRTIDFCTQKYVERILKIRSVFDEGIYGYLENKRRTSIENINIKLAKKCIVLIDKILKGKYVFISGEERLVIENDRYVKINFTSSGQQESVWIFNILMYQLINRTKTFLILEEPEAHLYPNAQKGILELLALFMSDGNSTLITTHSPYILGATNNLLYANALSENLDKNAIEAVVASDYQIHSCDAYFVEKGKIESCFDEEYNLIKNEVIDGAAEEINMVFDKLIELSNGD